jgi:hypothetical protein
MNISLAQLEIFEADQWPNDPFFGAARKLIFRGVKSIAAISQYPDLLFCLILLDSRNLAERVKASELDDLIKDMFLRCQCPSFSAETKNAIRGDAIHQLMRLLPERLDIKAIVLRQVEIERLLPSIES